MSATAKLSLPCKSPEDAQRAVASLAPDNDGYAKAHADGAMLVVEASAETPMGLLRTLDDLLECLRAAGFA